MVEAEAWHSPCPARGAADPLAAGRRPARIRAGRREIDRGLHRLCYVLGRSPRHSRCLRRARVRRGCGPRGGTSPTGAGCPARDVDSWASGAGGSLRALGRRGPTRARSREQRAGGEAAWRHPGGLGPFVIAALAPARTAQRCCKCSRCTDSGPSNDCERRSRDRRCGTERAENGRQMTRSRGVYE